MHRAILNLFFTLVYFPRQGYLTFYPTVFWTPNNCRFSLNKPNEKGYFIKVKSMGNMAFMCPHLSIWAGKSEKSPHRTMMYENILLVDEEGYNSCSVKNGTMKTLLRCDEDPMGGQVKYTNEKFSSTQAHRDKQCYEQGQHYYFISTSDGSMGSLNSTEGGHCRTHHMKLHIYVCTKNEPCEFEMPECPKKRDNNGSSTTPAPETRNCSDDSLPVSAQTGLKGWFTDNRHPVLYAVMGLVILVLFVIILWLIHLNRGYKRLHSAQQEKKKKSSVEKEPIFC